MKDGWETKRLGEVCEIIKGRKPVLKTDRSNGDLPYLVAKVMRGSVDAEYASVKDRNSVTVEESETIIICDGSNSGEVFTNFRGILSSTMGKIAKKAEVDDNFLRAFLFSTFEIFNGAKTGAAIPHLDKDAMYQLEFPLPPLPEQRRIVGILDEAFAGIATAKATAEKNLQNARALFESHLQSVFTQRGKGWEKRSLVSVCELFVDSAHRTPKYQDEGIPALRPRDVVHGRLNLAGALRVSEAEYEIQSKRHKPRPGDIVYSRELSYGWAALLPKSPRVCLSQGICLFRPSSNLAAALLLYVLNGSIGREQAVRAAVGAAHPHINLGDIKSYSIPVPPLDEQRKITRQLDELSDEIRRLESIYQQKLAALEALKKSLLHQAFAGEL